MIYTSTSGSGLLAPEKWRRVLGVKLFRILRDNIEQEDIDVIMDMVVATWYCSLLIEYFFIIQMLPRYYR